MKGNKFGEITQNNGHYAVQGHSRSPMLVPIKSPYATSYTNLPPILHRFQVMADYMSNFASDRGSLHFNALAGGDLNIATSNISLKTRFFGLHFICIMYPCIFNYFYVIGPKCYWIRQNNVNYTAITAFKVIQNHRFWYQSKAHMRHPISD